MLQVRTNGGLDNEADDIVSCRPKSTGINVEVTYTRKKRRVSCVRLFYLSAKVLLLLCFNVLLSYLAAVAQSLCMHSGAPAVSRAAQDTGCRPIMQ